MRVRTWKHHPRKTGEAARAVVVLLLETLHCRSRYNIIYIFTSSVFSCSQRYFPFPLNFPLFLCLILRILFAIIFLNSETSDLGVGNFRHGTSTYRLHDSIPNLGRKLGYAYFSRSSDEISSIEQANNHRLS